MWFLPTTYGLGPVELLLKISLSLLLFQAGVLTARRAGSMRDAFLFSVCVGLDLSIRAFVLPSRCCLDMDMPNRMPGIFRSWA
jgi:hypothetical protein